MICHIEFIRPIFSSNNRKPLKILAFVFKTKSCPLSNMSMYANIKVLGSYLALVQNAIIFKQYIKEN